MPFIASLFNFMLADFTGTSAEFARFWSLEGPYCNSGGSLREVCLLSWMIWKYDYWMAAAGQA